MELHLVKLNPKLPLRCQALRPQGEKKAFRHVEDIFTIVEGNSD